MNEGRTQYFEAKYPNEVMKSNKGLVSYRTLSTNNEMSKKLLENLWQCNEAMGLEVFYFILDVETLRISEKKGIYQALGYFDNDFSLDTYIAAIPAPQKTAFSEHWQDIFKGLNDTRPARQQQTIITLHGIKKQNGDCLYVKRISMPHQLNSAGNVTEYLCLFTVVSAYEGQSFQIRAANQITRKKPTKQQEDQKSFVLPFTRKELELLRAYADDHNLTATRLAESWCVSYNTVLTHKNNAMTKARKHLALHFPNVSTLAKKLREMGMV